MTIRDPALLHGKLCGAIIDAFYTVRNTLGPDFLEQNYQRALNIELDLRGIPAVMEAPVHVQYKGHVVGVYRADLVVDGAVIVECKVADRLVAGHRAQIINYLRASDKEVGLLLNFGVRPAFERIVATKRS